MEDAQFARDVASGVYIIDLPSAQAAIPGGLESPATSFAGSDETKVLEEPIVADGGSSSNILDGGFRAWLVVVGGFLDFAIAFGKFAVNLLVYIGSLNCMLVLISAYYIGLVNSFGTFQARYEAQWTWLSTSTITWIGSVQVCNNEQDYD